MPPDQHQTILLRSFEIVWVEDAADDRDGDYTDGDGGVMDLNPATPGCLFSTIAGVLVALATPAPSASCQALFDKVVGKPRS